MAEPGVVISVGLGHCGVALDWCDHCEMVDPDCKHYKAPKAQWERGQYRGFTILSPRLM